MSQAHGRSPQGPAGGDGGGRDGWDPDSREARLTRATQVRELVDAFAAVGVDVGVGGEDGDAGDRFDEMSFLYARGAVLTRDADVARVRRALGLDERPPAKDVGDERAVARRPVRGRERAGSSAGLTRIELDGRDTLEAVAELDRVLGPGVATPDHVLHVCPKGYACPATEPVPSDGPADPAPRDPALGTGVRVVVVDTGLVGELAQKVDVLAGVTGDEEDAGAVGRYRGHGSFIAGIVKAMAPAAEVDVEAMLWVGGGILESDLAPALGRALESVPDVISLSAGATTRHGHPLLALEAFWEHRLRHVKGTVLVCAAGNNGDRGPFWPATFPWAVAVGALEPDGSRAPYSDHGSWVDVWARGSDVVGPYPVGDYTYAWPPHVGDTASFGSGWASWSGTSFATPLVAGLVAARASWSGESARVAARSLVRAARAHATPYVGAVLEPGMADAP